MTKEEILDYVMNTPENTNRMVLNDMLDEFSSGGGGGSDVVIVEGHYDETDTYFILDKTWNELFSLSSNGKIVVMISGSFEAGYLSTYTLAGLLTIGQGVYHAYFAYVANGSVAVEDFTCDSADGYPQIED